MKKETKMFLFYILILLYVNQGFPLRFRNRTYYGVLQVNLIH